MPPRTIVLEAAESRLVLVPETGGSIAAWRHRGEDVLRPLAPFALETGSPRALGCFLLIPFSGRVRDGVFSSGGETFRLDRLGGGDHAIHGNAWQRAWRAEVSADRALLSLDHMPDGAWPFAYAARVEYALAADGMAVSLALENRDARPMPAGMGLHPFFPAAPDVTLGFRAGHVWRNDAGLLPQARESIPPEWDFRSERPLGQPGLNNGFSGWDGRARLAWPARGLALAIAADSVFAHLVVYTPERDFFCVEPVTHLANALNLAETAPDHGLRVLAPGETMRGEIRLTLSRSAP